MDKRRKGQASKIRQEILTISGTIANAMAEVIKARTLIKGTICQKVRKCGNPTCKCSRGELHETTILSFSDNGKSRIIHLSKHSAEELSRITKNVKEYQRFRKVRADIVYYFKQIIVKLNKLERTLIIEVSPAKGAEDDKGEKRP